MGIESAARNQEFQRLIRLQTEAFANGTPYHTLELRDGTEIPGLIPIAALRARLDAWPLPQDLRGKRVLDIGAASGWNSFECERRGAEVLALENVCAVTRGLAFIESYVIDNEPDPERCHMEFYETGELGGQIDNWCGPTLSCLMAMARSAGFARAEFLYAGERRGGVLAHRRWESFAPEHGAAAPFLCSALNNRHDDIVFQPRKDEYICLAFFDDGELRREDVLVEIDRFGVPAILLLKHPAGHWQVNVKVPLAPGDHDVRVGTRRGGFSEPVRIRMLPGGAERVYGETPFIAETVEVEAPRVVLVENKRDRSRLFRGFRSEMLACRFIHYEAGPLDLSKVQLTVDGNP